MLKPAVPFALWLLVVSFCAAPAQVPPVPDVAYTPHAVWYGPYAEKARVNLLDEGGSFEVGADDALDGGWLFLERRYYTRWLDRNQGALYLTTGEPPRVVAIPGGPGSATHGARCVRLHMRNRSAPQLFGRAFLAPSSGTYRVSLAVLGDAAVTSRPALSVHLRDANGKVMANRGVTPATSWQRVSFTTAPLTAGKPYYLWLGFGTWEPSRSYPDQSVWIDAVRIAPPGAASPTAYAHPTTLVSLAARTALKTPGGLTGRRPFDIFWAGEDDGKRRLAADVFEEKAIQGTLSLRVHLYDSRGVPTRPATALASTTLALTTHPGRHQTLEVDVDRLLQGAGRGLGFYLAVLELKDAGGSWIDRAEAPFAVLRRAPATIPEPARSPFGGHLLVFRSIYENRQVDFWNLYGTRCNAAVADHLRLMRDVGCRWSRSFQLFNYEASRYYTQKAPRPTLAWPPPASVPGICKEYADLFRSFGVGLVGVFYGEKRLGPTHVYYRNCVREMVAGYGPRGVNHGEVLNEPNHGQHYMPPATYAAWLASTRKEADAVRAGFQILGPVTTYGDVNYIKAVFNTVTSGGLGYKLLDGVTYHRYLKGDDTFPWNLLGAPALQSDLRRGAEDAYKRKKDSWPQCSEWEMRAMAGERVPPYNNPLLKPSSLGGGPVDKPIWITEWAGRYPEIRSDKLRFENTGQIHGGFSGSLTLARRAAARMVRFHLVALGHGVGRLFHWDTTFSGWKLSPWRLLGEDCSPTPALAAYSHLTNRLEGFDFLDAVTPAELPDNGVDPYYTRCLVFAERRPANPRRPAAVAALWNWAGDEFDHRPGSGVYDPYDPTPSGRPVVIPRLALNPAAVEVTDVEGRVLHFGGTAITSLRLDENPVYLKTRPGASLQELMLALDAVRPKAPSRVNVAYDPNLRRARISAPVTAPAPDVRAFGVYREDHGPGTWAKIGEFTVKQGHLDDRPGTGIWRYRITAIEEYTGYETAPSPPSALVQVPPPGAPRLLTDRETIDPRKGGSAFLTFEAGTRNARRPYAVAASLSGYYPGVSVGPHLHLALNIDAFTFQSLFLANRPPFVAFQGLLDTGGRARAEFRVPAGLKLNVAVPVTFAAATLNPLDVATNPVVVTLTRLGVRP